MQYSPEPLARVMFIMYSCISRLSSGVRVENRRDEYYVVG